MRFLMRGDGTPSDLKSRVFNIFSICKKNPALPNIYFQDYQSFGDSYAHRFKFPRKRIQEGREEGGGRATRGERESAKKMVPVLVYDVITTS